MFDDPDQDGLDSLAERAAARAGRRAADRVADFFMAGDARLDDRTRQLLAQALDTMVGDADRTVRRDAARRLSRAGDDEAAEALLGVEPVAPLIARPEVVSAAIVEELAARVRHDLIAEALPIATGDPEVPSLLVRLADDPVPSIAMAAADLFEAENRRRAGEAGSELGERLHGRLIWLVAGALRMIGPRGIDAALAAAAVRLIDVHDAAAALEPAAARLARALNACTNRAALMTEALGDRRLALFIALLAEAVGLDGAEVRALVIEPDDERLWLALRAAGLDRATIARIALSLADADPRRDIERFAERIDAIVAVDPGAARTALAPLALPAGMRAAMRVVAAA